MFKIEENPRKNFRVRLSDKSIALPIHIEETLLEDPEMWFGYKSNIAMAFVDVAYWYKKRNKKQYLSNDDIHNIGNEAAQHFLQLWLKQ